MALFDKEKTDDIAKVLLENDTAILAGLAQLKEKIDAMDKSNKKFLMGATMGKTELLEKDNIKLKMGIISLLDQIDLLMSAVMSSDADSLKKGMDTYYKSIQDITSGLGLKVIHTVAGEPFNPKEQECAEVVHLEDYEDDTVTVLYQRGYIDKSSGNILRCAKVAVNRQKGHINHGTSCRD